jgi:hypothetical protein
MPSCARIFPRSSSSLAAAAAPQNFRAQHHHIFDVGSDGLYRKGLQFKQRQLAA